MTPVLPEYDKAPPFWLPLAFMLAAPCWLLATVPIVAALPAAPPVRFWPDVLALTHMLTLGVLGNVMIGALWQLLAVTAGMPVAHPRRLLWAVHPPLQLGCLLLATGFRLGLSPAWLQAGASLLVPALLIPAWFGLSGLIRHPVRGAPHKGMGIALCGLMLVVLTGLAMVLLLGGYLSLPLDTLLDVHVLWGMLGWIFMLVLSVARMIIPLFLIAPGWKQHGLIQEPVFFGLFCLASAGLMAGLSAVVSWLVVIAGGLLVLVCLHLFLMVGRCKRRLDPSRSGWQASLVWAVLAAACGMAVVPDSGWNQALPVLTGFLWLGGFGLGTVLNMQGKILPFLAWLNLGLQGLPRKRLPTTHAFMSEASHRRLLYLHAVWTFCGIGWVLGGIPLPLAVASAGLGLYWAWLAGKLLYRYLHCKGFLCRHELDAM
ncbi:hypothetical protein LH447_12510 [Laribacter hongkongensis]|uniref:hypothetical protein n=1 Tax=Laribacter hongkongensis TaxID=168471 RepID=UPI001EFCA4C2|nr:hypothetical protein [Laribacter hongkongensis]MCG9053903.1 hypothetical protein [Laribacter hongkongensis]